MALRRSAIALALALAAAVALAACAPVPTDSGVRGIVTIGPTSPVQRQGESGEAPYSARLLFRSSAGGTTSVTSGRDGRFVVDLAPGTYSLEPQSPGPLPIAQPQTVVVVAHHFTDVTVRYDSGIR